MKGSKDLEFIELRNRFFVGLLIAGVIIIVVAVFFYQRFTFGVGVSSKMVKKQDFVIFMDSYDCGEKCDNVKKVLDINNVSYEVMKLDSTEGENFINKYNIIDNGEVVPAVIYIKAGKVYSSLFEVTNTSELELFLKNYHLSK